MAKEQGIKERGEFNALQIAGLAIVASTAAAVGTLLAVRHWGIVPSRSAVLERADRHGSVLGKSPVQSHFSEDSILPNITYTGPEVEAHNSAHGRSAEGV